MGVAKEEGECVRVDRWWSAGMSGVGRRAARLDGAECLDGGWG